MIRTRCRTIGQIGCVICVALLTVWAAQTTKSSVEKHPYDTMVSDLGKPSRQAANSLQVIGAPGGFEKLGLSPDQANQVRRLLEDCQLESKILWERFRKENPDKKSFRPFQAAGTEQLAVETDRRIRNLLTESQKSTLRQICYQSLGWDFVFIESAQNRLRLTDLQLETIKDLQVAKIKARSKWIRSRRKATEQQRPELDLQWEHQRAQFESDCSAVLNDRQLTIRSELLGS